MNTFLSVKPRELKFWLELLDNISDDLDEITVPMDNCIWEHVGFLKASLLSHIAMLQNAGLRFGELSEAEGIEDDLPRSSHEASSVEDSEGEPPW